GSGLYRLQSRLLGADTRRHRAQGRDRYLHRPNLRRYQMIQELEYFQIPWLDLKLLFLVAAGTSAGVYVGAIPGLSVTMAVSILIGFTFTWDVNSALCLMVGIFMGGVYGGSRTAMLLNIPVAPSAIATAMDGYPMAPK